jgi:hypothetical protein
MIHKGLPPNRTQKLITQQVNLAIREPPATPEYLNWYDERIHFSRDDDPIKVPRLGHSPLVVDADQIAGYD